MSDFIEKLKKLEKVRHRLPQRAAVVAVNFSKERFVRKNWVDTSPQAWPKRKRKDRGSLMIRTGRLKRSIRKLMVTKDYILIGTDVPYAQVHNEGGSIKKNVPVRRHERKTSRGRAKVKAHSRNVNLKMPQRQFIGNSAILRRRIERLIERDIKRVLK